MLEKLFLKHGHCAISWGENILFLRQGFLRYGGRKLPLCNEMCWLALLPTHGCARCAANTTQNYLSLPHSKDFGSKLRAHGRTIWVVDSQLSSAPVELKLFWILPVLSDLVSTGHKESSSD